MCALLLLRSHRDLLQQQPANLTGQCKPSPCFDVWPHVVTCSSTFLASPSQSSVCFLFPCVLHFGQSTVACPPLTSSPLSTVCFPVCITLDSQQQPPPPPPPPRHHHHSCHQSVSLCASLWIVNSSLPPSDIIIIPVISLFPCALHSGPSRTAAAPSDIIIHIISLSLCRSLWAVDYTCPPVTSSFQSSVCFPVHFTLDCQNNCSPL